MSVFGGDSWAREAQHRKRRVDDLLLNGFDSSSYKKLSNGRLACLVCPNSPVLDSPSMFSMHSKGSRHRNAETKLRDKELRKQNEINKRIALSASSAAPSGVNSQNLRIRSKPLIKQPQKTSSNQVLDHSTCQQNSAGQTHNINLIKEDASSVTASFRQTNFTPESGESEKGLVKQNLDLWKQWERELKFTAAGWKRDCHGNWYKDENVEFDSDEEDPNVCLG